MNFARLKCIVLNNYQTDSTGVAALTDHITLFSSCYSAALYFQNNGAPPSSPTS